MDVASIPSTAQFQWIVENPGETHSAREILLPTTTLASITEELVLGEQDNMFSQPIQRPQRARKVGFGTHEMDVIILEAIKGEAVQKPVISPDLLFICTTDSSKREHNKWETVAAEDRPHNSYFESVEVMLRIRKQMDIEKPIFSKATAEDIRVAEENVPQEVWEEHWDYSDAAYERRHKKAERNEVRTRTHEKEKFEYNKYKFTARVEQLKTMEPSFFRGETLEEQEKDKENVVFHANRLFRKYENADTNWTHDPEAEGDGSRVNGVSLKRKARHGDNVTAELLEDGQDPNGAKKPAKKKESRYQYWDDNEALRESPIPILYEDKDGDYSGGGTHKKSKKKAAGERAPTNKRKRDPDDDEKPSKKKQRASSTSLIAPPPSNVPQPDKSVLLIVAKRYNSNRPGRDLAPFGAPMPSKIHKNNGSLEFDIPYWLEHPGTAEEGLEDGVGGIEEQVVQSGDEDAEGEIEEVLPPVKVETAETESSELTEVDDPPVVNHAHPLTTGDP